MVLYGRSPLECYTDYMREFRNAFADEIGELIEEIIVGSGPCGELRYPARFSLLPLLPPQHTCSNSLSDCVLANHWVLHLLSWSYLTPTSEPAP